MKNRLSFFSIAILLFNFCLAQKIDNSQILTCAAKPTTTIVGGSIVLSGQTLNDGKQTNLKITIINPDKTKRNATASLTTDGNYNYTIKALDQVGLYQCEVATADNKFRKTVSFTIIKNEDIAKITDALVQNFNDLKNKLNSKIQKCKAQLPPVLQAKLTEAVS